MSRAWLRHPRVDLRPPRPCPSGLPRFRTRWLALASIPAGCNPRLTPIPCALCHGVHLTDPTRPAAAGPTTGHTT